MQGLCSGGSLRRLAILVLALVAFSAGRSPAFAADDIPLGVCQSTAQGAAKFAAALWKGAELATADINGKGGVSGRPIKLVPVDIGNNDPAQARLSFNKAAQVDKIVSLLCWGTNVMVGNGPLIDELDIAAFTMSQGVNVVKNSKLTQQLEAVTTLQCRVAAAHVQDRYPAAKTLAVLYVNYEYGIELRDKCEQEFGKRGITLVASEAHPNAPPDLRAQLTKLLEAKPDAIYLAGIGGGTIALGIRTGRELGYKGVFITHGAGDTPDVYNLKLAEQDFFFVSHAVPAGAPEEVRKATDEFGGYAGAGYDFVSVNAQIIGKLLAQKKPLTGTNIIAELRATKTVTTPVNQFVFLEDGNTIRPLALFTIDDGGRKLEKILSAAEIN